MNDNPQDPQQRISNQKTWPVVHEQVEIEGRETETEEVETEEK